MTEQELRDTIVKHIVRLNNVCKTNAVCKDCKYADYDRCTEYAIADALIAAGIGDVKEAEAEANRYEMLYKLQNQDMALAERRAHDAEHRAEVAERALRVLARKVVIFAFPNGDWKELIEQLVSEAKEQAEKELAEEGK